MATKINVKNNFTSVFAQFNTVEDIKSLANNICAQVKEAYDARLAEITKPSEGIVIQVETTSEAPKAEAKQEVKKPAAKKGSKTERAKAAAEKFKKQAEKEPKSAPKAETKQETPKAETKESKKSEDVIIAITDLKAIKKLGLTFTKYNDKCYVLRGNTKPLRKSLPDFKGVFNSHLTGGEGWVFRPQQAEECAKALGIKFKVA